MPIFRADRAAAVHSDVEDEMTATERLRAMLDERGVEWGNVRRDGSESNYLTEWQFDGNQGIATAIEWSVGGGLSVDIHRHHLTPEQAIAATLGEEQTIEYLRQENIEWEDMFRRECSENAKLRELVQELYEDQCDECDRWKYRDRMRELGVEV